MITENALSADELSNELSKVNAELEKIKKQKRPFEFGNEVIELQSKRIQELEDKLDGWFVEKEKLTKEKERLKQELKIAHIERDAALQRKNIIAKQYADAIANLTP